MKQTLMLALMLLTFLYSASSFAGLLLEPIVGLNWVNKYDVDGGKNYNSGAGLAYGGKIGFAAAGLQIGGDFMRYSSDMSNGDFDRNLETSEQGVFVGFKFPVLIKLYGEYIFAASGDTKINDTKQSLKKGTGAKIGVGFTLLPFLDLNLDYRRVSFRDQDLDSFMASVSLPFDLF